MADNWRRALQVSAEEETLPASPVEPAPEVS